MNKIARFFYHPGDIHPAGFTPQRLPKKGERADTGRWKAPSPISGAFALYPMMQRWAEEFNKVIS